MNIYIKDVSHISNQEPFLENWFENPIIYNQNYIRSIDPDYKQFFSAIESRRLGIILKRALATAINLTQKTGIQNPDAIITGTGLGCIENTEKFLNAMIDNDEEMLTPSYFMQSTHNTISSQIAIRLKCHGYNSTYSHCGTSFDSALFDAFMQFQLGEINTAIVAAHDELTPDYFKLLEKIKYWKNGEISEEILRKAEDYGSFAGEAAVAFMISNEEDNNNWAKIKKFEMFNKQPNCEKLEELNINSDEIDAVVVGLSGDKENDNVYKNFYQKYFKSKPIIWYKHIFGESYSVSGLGLYVAATIIKKQKITEHLIFEANKIPKTINKILFYNHFQNKSHSLILLEKSK